MVIRLKQRNTFQNQRLTLNEFYIKAKRIPDKQNILRTLNAQMSGISVKIVFVAHRSKRIEWLAILSTHCSLSEEKIIRIYGMRWDIETF